MNNGASMNVMFSDIIGIAAIIVTIVNAVIGYWVKQISKSQDTLLADQKHLESDMQAFEVKVAETYVSKTDYYRDIFEIKQMLSKIFDKLDTKADR